MYIISSYKWRSPYTINIEDPETSLQNIVRPLEKAVLEENVLTLGENRLKILLHEASTYPVKRRQVKPNPLSKDQLEKLTLYYRIIATLWPDFYNSIEYKRICRLTIENPVLSPYTLEKIIGLGRGFTPSGDDFINGYISAHYYYNKMMNNEWRPGIPLELLEKTTWASKHYIIYSMNGVYDELGEKTLYSMYAGEQEQAFNSILHYARRGHESGLYIWLGLITGFAETIHNDKNIPLEPVCREAYAQ